MPRNRLLGAILMAWLAAPAAAADWPMLMGGAQHAGVAPSAGAPSGTFRLAWRFEAHAEIRSSPVVADGKVFVGAENGNLYALDLATKKLLWLYHAEGGIGATPALADGVLYFLSRDGRFHALDAASGAPLWTFRTRGEGQFAAHGMFGTPLGAEPVPDPWDLYLSSALVHKGVVYFGSSDERVYALDAKSGKPVWVYKTGGVVHSSPALSGANIVIGSWDGALYALDAASGAERWRFQTRTEQKDSIMLGIQASPSADADTVYAGSRDGYFYALDAASGKQKWRYDAKGSWIVGTAAHDADNVYVGTSDTGLLVALDKRTGAERYRFSTGVWTFSSPLRVGGLLVGASMKGKLHVLDAATGRERWSYQDPASGADAFHVLDPATGKLDSARLYQGGPHALYSALEHVKRLGAFISSPAWHDGQLIIANANGEVLFFDQAAN